MGAATAADGVPPDASNEAQWLPDLMASLCDMVRLEDFAAGTAVSSHGSVVFPVAACCCCLPLELVYLFVRSLLVLLLSLLLSLLLCVPVCNSHLACVAALANDDTAFARQSDTQSGDTQR
jgi:hypothetical protein